MKNSSWSAPEDSCWQRAFHSYPRSAIAWGPDKETYLLTCIFWCWKKIFQFVLRKFPTRPSCWQTEEWRLRCRALRLLDFLNFGGWLGAWFGALPLHDVGHADLRDNSQWRQQETCAQENEDTLHICQGGLSGKMKSNTKVMSFTKTRIVSVRHQWDGGGRHESGPTPQICFFLKTQAIFSTYCLKGCVLWRRDHATLDQGLHFSKNLVSGEDAPDNDCWCHPCPKQGGKKKRKPSKIQKMSLERRYCGVVE